MEGLFRRVDGLEVRNVSQEWMHKADICWCLDATLSLYSSHTGLATVDDTDTLCPLHAVPSLPCVLVLLSPAVHRLSTNLSQQATHLRVSEALIALRFKHLISASFRTRA